MLSNDKIQSFFSNQLRELKDHYKEFRGGRVYIAPNKEKALNRCLELADFEVCVNDCNEDLVICECGQSVFAYVCVDPVSRKFFVVGVCDCGGVRNEN